MPYFHYDGIQFYFEVFGEGSPFVFSHGLGGSLERVRELLYGLPGLKTILYDNRAHGRTTPLGNPSRLSFRHMAEDIARLLDHLGIANSFIGGVSMGAGIALSFGLGYPQRAKALVLSRPAWLHTPAPPHLGFAPILAELIERVGLQHAFHHFQETAYCKQLNLMSPQAVESLREVVRSGDAASLIAAYRYMTKCTPYDSLDQLRSLSIPALVLGSHDDPIHPFSVAETWAHALPSAQLCELPSRYVDPAAHNRRFREAVANFLGSVTFV